MEESSQQLAFSQGFNVWGIQYLARLQPQLSAVAVPPPGVSTSTQPTVTIALAFIY